VLMGRVKNDHNKFCKAAYFLSHLQSQRMDLPPEPEQFLPAIELFAQLNEQFFFICPTSEIRSPL